jgi:alcohol dehydrogenase (cytochrome c)
MTIAFNPVLRVMYFPIEETCMDFHWQPDVAYQPGGPHMDIGWSVKPRPDSDGNYARLEAVDMTTLKTLWVRRSRSPLSSSLLLTKGGILFSGSRDRTFSALNESRGNTLWSVRLNAVPNSSPITYSVDGKQFVAVVTGGGGFHDAGSEQITPEIDNGAPSTTLWVFSIR